MKTTIDYLNCLNFKNTKNFEKNVLKQLPEGVEKIILDVCGMTREGSGSYNYFLDVNINGEMITLKSFTHSSPAWDEYTDMETGSRKHVNFMKQVTLMLLEECKNEIVEFIEECNEDEF